MVTDTNVVPAMVSEQGDIPGGEFCLAVGPDEACLSPALFSRSSGIVAIVDQGIASAATFLASIIVGRFAGPTELGIYSLAFTLMLLCFAAQDALVLAALTVFYHDVGSNKQREKDEYLANTSRQQLLLSLVLSSIMFVVGLVVTIFIGNVHLGSTIVAAAAALPFVLFREFTRRAHCIRGEIGEALRLDSIVAAIWAAGLVALVLLHKLTPASVFLAQAVACSYAVTYRCRTKVSKSSVWPQIAKHFKFGRWIVASQVAFMAHQYLAYWLLALWHGPEATGGFAAAVTLVSIANPLTMGLGNYFGPKMSHDLASSGRTQFLRTTGNAIAVVGGMMALIVLFLALGGSAILPLLFGSRFHGQHAIVVILAVSNMVAAVRMMLDLSVRTMKQPAWVFAASITGLMTNLTIAITLMPRWRELGAAYGNLAGSVAPIAILCVAFWTCLKTMPREDAAEEAVSTSTV